MPLLYRTKVHSFSREKNSYSIDQNSILEHCFVLIISLDKDRIERKSDEKKFF